MTHLDHLRKLMKEHDVQGYLIPHADEFQSEYTAPYAERLRFLTGFTGSAGIAIIGESRAAFFTDGRYTLQSEQELDTKSFDIFHISKTKPHDWIKENIKGTIGYDPWLFTPNQLKRYEEKSISLKAIDGNLVDQVWGEDQPNRPIDPYFIQPLDFAGESHLERATKVGEKVGESGAQKALITNPDSLCWLLNIRGDDVVYTPFVLGYALLDADGTYDVFVDLKKINSEVYAHLSPQGRIIDLTDIGKHLSRVQLKEVKSIQVDPNSIPLALEKMLKDAEIEVLYGSDPCQLPKAIKNKTELEGMKKAHIRDGLALVKFFTWLSQQPLEGETTEWTASLKVNALRSENDHFYDLSFETISGYGPHGAVIHYKVTPDKALPIGRDSLYLIDSGGQYFDGTTDVTRTLCFGQPTAEQKDRYTRVLKGHIALAMAKFPKGTTGSQLDILARNSLWQVGLDYDHGTGHGVGSFLSVHEGPQGISKTSNAVALEPGMILSNEPGYYKEGDYGIRIESLVFVREISNGEKPFYGFETLTMAPLSNNLIDKDLLSIEEIGWVNDYHQQVLAILAPQLEEAERQWLETATAKI